MLHRIKVIDLELSHEPASIEGADGYLAIKALVRLHGTPIGFVQLPVINGSCSAKIIRKTILEQHSWPIIRHLLQDMLQALPRFDGWHVEDLLKATHPESSKTLPMVTVAVCTRDGADDLTLCLDALDQLDYPNVEILIVDNAPRDDATKRLVTESYPHMCYVREQRPGLDWARNRAIIEARGEIVAYTDDDVVVDPGWVRALVNVFAEDPEVVAVTGLVVPFELETKAQMLFEINGGFGRGFTRKWYQLNRASVKKERFHLGAGEFGTGANMAFRRNVFEQIGLFDPALDVGTVTSGGGDLEMFFRVLKEGHRLVYEPAALVRHCHRRDYPQLRKQIANNGIGLISFWVRSASAYRDERFSILRSALSWLWRWYIRRSLTSFVRPARLPRDLILAELKGYLVGLSRYHKARKIAGQVAETFGPFSYLDKQDSPREIPKLRNSIAVRTIELSKPVISLNDVTDCANVRIFVAWHDQPLGSIDIANCHQPISALRLRETIANYFRVKLLTLGRDSNIGTLWADTVKALSQKYLPLADNQNEATETIRLPADIVVSVVIATLDRPADLRNCLFSLKAQETPRQIEIIVVDNNPASGLTPAVIAEFPGVVLVNEPRKGLAYARNAGFRASTGDIVLTTDDDVILPPDWLERLVAPFIRDDVMIVTGNTLPKELKTNAQRLFERYGGLGRGFEPFEADGIWFESYRRKAVPTWKLGATANAAFRASIFTHPQIGLMYEALGPGMPSGVGEDTYLFYKVLKAGYKIVYAPSAYVWHKHRKDMSGFRRQIYNYSKGHVAYHLTTLIRDKDLRAINYLLNTLPRWRLKQLTRQIKATLWGNRKKYPISLILLEIKGNLAGPWCLWQSYRRVKREGRSDPYIPLSQRQQRSVLADRQEDNSIVPNIIQKRAF